MKTFDEIVGLPSRFFEIESCEIESLFPRPTLVHLPGEREPALFVSILLHGNENAGLLALQDFFRHVPIDRLPRAMSIFIGNVRACGLGVRFAKDQIDFNRAWPGSDLPHSETHDLLAEVTERVLSRSVFASVDIHNNTGRNPLYGCICSLAPHHVQFASLFSRKAIYFTRPKGVQTQAFMQHCPAVTLECGEIGDLAGAEAASLFLQRCIATDELKPETADGNAEIYHTVARIKIRDDCSIGFEPGNDIVLREDLDLLNFIELEKGESLGRINLRLEDCFIVNDEHGVDVTQKYLACSDQNQVVLGRNIMPSMLTRNISVMKQDCLGYFMERLSHHDA